MKIIIHFLIILKMPFHRNFTYYIDKRSWKYYFLMLALAKGFRR